VVRRATLQRTDKNCLNAGLIWSTILKIAAVRLCSVYLFKTYISSFCIYSMGVCLQVLQPYYRARFYTLFILDMGNRTIYIMNPLSINAEYKVKDPSMLYITRLQDIANKFKLTMELAHPT
jgi:hypothetical protein